MTPRTRLAWIVGYLAFVAGTFALFWQMPGNVGPEGPGHWTWHVTNGVAGLALAVVLYRGRTPRSVGQAFREDFGASLAFVAFEGWAFFQLVAESAGAYVTWTTGDETVHDLAVIGPNFAAEIAIVIGLLIWAVQAIVRRERRRAAAPARA